MSRKYVTSADEMVKKKLSEPNMEVNGAVTYQAYTPSSDKSKLDRSKYEIDGNVRYTTPTQYTYDPSHQDTVNKQMSNYEINGNATYTPIYNGTRTPSTNNTNKNPVGNTVGNKDFYDANGNLRPNIAQEIMDAAAAGRFGRDMYGDDSVDALSDLLRQKVANQGGYFEGGDVNQWINGVYQKYSKAANDSMQRQKMLDLLRQDVGSKYDSLYRSLLDKYTNYGFDEFRKSAQYRSLSDMYSGQGRSAMKDVLGEVSARTGGLASSYATAAAQAQYNDYMERLANAAQQAYQGERGYMLGGLREIGNRADNEIARETQRRNALYNALNDFYQQDRNKEQSEKDNARAMIQYMLREARVGVESLSPSLVEKSGYTDSELAAMAKEASDALAKEEKAEALTDQDRARDYVTNMLTKTGAKITDFDEETLAATGFSEGVLQALEDVWTKAENQTDREYAQNYVMTFLTQTPAKAEDLPEDIKAASGYTEAEMKALEQVYLNEQAASRVVGGSSGGMTEYQRASLQLQRDKFDYQREKDAAKNSSSSGNTGNTLSTIPKKGEAEGPKANAERVIGNTKEGSGYKVGGYSGSMSMSRIESLMKSGEIVADESYDATTGKVKVTYRKAR